MISFQRFGTLRFRRRDSGILVPTLATPPQGATIGGAISAGAAGFALLFDTNATGTPPTLLSGDGWTNIQTATFSTARSCRLSYKTVTNGESVTEVSGGRRILRIYNNVNLSSPIEDSDNVNGTDEFADLPAMTLNPLGNLVIGFVCCSGNDVPIFPSPIDQNEAHVGTSAISGAAESAGLLFSFAGAAVNVVFNDHVGVVVAVNGASA